MASVWKSYSFSILLTPPAGTSDAAMLSYDGTLSRVRIDLTQAVANPNTSSQWPAGYTWAVQRSSDLVHWSTVRGGASIPVTANPVKVDDYEFDSGVQDTYQVLVYDTAGTLAWTFRDQIIATITEPWLKVLRFPFLNRVIVNASATPITRAARVGVFDVVGSSLPIAVTNRRGPRAFELTVATLTETERAEMDATLDLGDVIFLQVPPGYPLPGGHYSVQDTTEDRRNMPWERRWWTLPLTAVRAPSPDIVGGTMTYQGLTNRYPTYAIMAEQQPTYRGLLELVADPSDVSSG